MQEFAREYSELLTSLAILSGVMFVASLIAVPWLLARLPADYFVREHPHRKDDGSRWYLWLAGKIFKNLIGAILFLAGLVMLGLPGQGLITMLIGLTLIDYPGKRQLELKLIRRPKILRGINWMRERYGQPPLQTEVPHPVEPASPIGRAAPPAETHERVQN